jgi:hypothetical protein
LDYLDGAVSNPNRPFAAIVGGSKVSSKIGVIESLLEKVDILLLGGGMIFTFYKAQGLKVGASLVEEDKLELATSLIEKAKAKGVSLLLPTDVVIADKFAPDANSKVQAFFFPPSAKCLISGCISDQKGVGFSNSNIVEVLDRLWQHQLFQMAGWVLILAQTQLRHSIQPWTPLKLSYGMVPWECLSLKSLRKGLRFVLLDISLYYDASSLSNPFSWWPRLP